MNYLAYNMIADGYKLDDSTVFDYVRGIVWSELYIEEQTIAYGRYVGSLDGVNIYYDFGADYYFFTSD